MRIGVDFDNTIVCYEELFHKVARERGLIPAEIPTKKGGVRDYLRRMGRENAWTELQGYVYGARILEAPAFPGALDFFIRCKKQGVGVCVISHKTARPFEGPAYDLHRAAQEWLEARGFYDPAGAGLSRDDVFLELTKEEKLSRIAGAGCSHFIDDLPEFLEEPAFPKGVERIWFDPNGLGGSGRRYRRVGSWEELGRLLLSGRGAAA